MCYLPGFTFVVPHHPGSPGQNSDGCKTVVVVVVVVILFSLNTTVHLNLVTFMNTVGISFLNTKACNAQFCHLTAVKYS